MAKPQPKGKGGNPASWGGEKVTWGPRAAILLTILAFFLGQFVAAIVVGLAPAMLGWGEARVEDWLASTAGHFSYILAAEAITVGILWWFLRRRKAGFRALGFHRRPIWRDLGVALTGFLAYFGMLIVVTALSQGLLGVDTEQKQDLGFENITGAAPMLMTFVSLVVLPPLVEEMVFRGFLYGGLRRKMNMVAATIITSILFALPHLLTGETGTLLWIAAIDTFVLSLVLCYVREKTGNLWAPIAIHAIKNGLAFLYLFVFI